MDATRSALVNVGVRAQPQIRSQSRLTVSFRSRRTTPSRWWRAATALFGRPANAGRMASAPCGRWEGPTRRQPARHSGGARQERLLPANPPWHRPRHGEPVGRLREGGWASRVGRIPKTRDPAYPWAMRDTPEFLVHCARLGGSRQPVHCCRRAGARVLEWQRPGSFARLALPNGLAIDNAGDLNGPDSLNHRIRTIDTTGTMTTATSAGDTLAQFNLNGS